MLLLERTDRGGIVHHTPHEGVRQWRRWNRERQRSIVDATRYRDRDGAIADTGARTVAMAIVAGTQGLQRVAKVLGRVSRWCRSRGLRRLGRRRGRLDRRLDRTR